MEKIGILLAAVSFIGFTMAQEAPDCATFPTLLDVDKCCFKRGKNKFDYAYENCLKKFENAPHPEYCASECAVNETHIGNPDYTINYDGLRRLLDDQLQHDHILVDFMIQTVRDCEIKVWEMMQNPPYSTAENTPCSQGYNLLKRCVSNHAILYCPVQRWWIESDTCNKILKDTQSCPFGN